MQRLVLHMVSQPGDAIHLGHGARQRCKILPLRHDTLLYSMLGAKGVRFVLCATEVCDLRSKLDAEEFSK